MFQRVKNLIKEYRRDRNEIKSKLDEIEWANIYHDSIRGIDFLKNQSINIGRWSGNYSFFYVLNRILNDYKPKKILEFGLGESSKFIASYIKNYLKDSTHLIIEQDLEWAKAFEAKYNLPNNSKISIHPLQKKVINGFETNVYSDLDEITSQKFDLYLVDGPLGSQNYSRFQIVELIEKHVTAHYYYFRWLST